MKYILAMDQGTTSSRSIIFDKNGRIISLGQKDFRQIFPASGWVEHDPEDIWISQLESARAALAEKNIAAHEITAVGLTNQRETTILWHRETGLPVCNAIVWQDRRTSEFCDRLRGEHLSVIRAKTGLEIDAYFSASKVNWILENIAGAREQAERGELAFGTVDSWLLWKLTGGEKHLTDVSNASRTMLFNIETLEWDDELLGIFDIPKSILPAVKSSSEIFGEIKTIPELQGVKIAGMAGDQQAALFGQRCTAEGMSKTTYGTGCFMLQNIGEKPVASDHRLLTTIGWQIGEKVEYALEGSVFIGGAVVQWLRDGLGIIDSSDEIEALAGTVDDNGGVYFVPAFAGLGTPYWDQDARGLIIGLTRGTGKAHIARAAVESICFQTDDLIRAMEADSKIKLPDLRVDGGATRNDSLLQFQADISQIPVIRPEMTETTALGAAYLAGLAVGFWNRDELPQHQTRDTVFVPKISGRRAAILKENWHEAVKRSLGWKR